jgi:hypothetical protein
MTALTARLTDTTRLRARPDSVRFWLRIEGLAAFVAGFALYASSGGEWPWFFALLLVPDLSMAGYAAGPTPGALVYNAVHNWAVGLAIVGLGLAVGATPLVLAGAILVAHVGMDRVAGYGLKHPTGFRDTHLQRA